MWVLVMIVSMVLTQSLDSSAELMGDRSTRKMVSDDGL